MKETFPAMNIPLDQSLDVEIEIFVEPVKFDAGFW